MNKNREIAELFEEIAELLDFKGANPFRIRAYQRAAQNLESLTEDVEALVKQERLQEIPGIGADLAGKIQEYILKGRLTYYDELKKEVPEGILDIMAIPGVGPKTAKLLYDNLRIETLEDLEKAARQGRIRNIPHLKEKTEQNILKGIDIHKRAAERMSLGKALSVANDIILRLKELKEVKRISYAGSLRRMKETVRDIDILITSRNPQKVMDFFVSLSDVKKINAKGDTKSSVLLRDDVQVDLRVVEEDCFGAALLYFTGSKQHNIHLRDLAKAKGYKINEYGIFRVRDDKRIASKEEADIYKTLGMPYISPELREDSGEIEAALKNMLPELVEFKDIRGDFHIHSNYSDGIHSLEELAQAAKERGYSYIAICDHSRSLPVAGGLSADELLDQMEKIRQLNKRLKGITLLSGTEMDILSDGRLDFPDELLKKLDFVVAAIHSGFKQSQSVLTSRLVKAMQHKTIDLIAHPTGRLRGSRDAYPLDLDEVYKVASETNTALEINAYPDRLDLNDINARRAQELGVSLAIATDTHRLEHLDNIHLGVAIARRAWVRKEGLLNTLSLERLKKYLNRRRQTNKSS